MSSSSQVFPFSADIENGGRSISSSSTPALFWNNVTYKVQNKGKTILDDCSGVIMPGQLCALMGPSGTPKMNTTQIESAPMFTN
jgi:ABC-type multidrug transport system fused ATPase/permease subunit